MSERSRLLIALAAGFGLVLLGGVITHLTAPAASEAPPGDTFVGSAATDSARTEPVAPPGQEDAPTEVTSFEARKRRYRQLIEEANRRLRRQQRALDEARRRLEALPPAPRRDDRSHGGEREEGWEPSDRLAWNEHERREHDEYEHQDHAHEYDEHEDDEHEARDDD